MTNFKVSVIIPVYNAEKYLEKCVKSAVNLKEVGEIILIEDASPDNALEVCKELAHQYEKVKLYQHPNGENRGPGASRNLGIKKAICDFIAFLDADDWYLSTRFQITRQIFETTQAAAVYEAVGAYFENDLVKDKFFKRRGIFTGRDKYLTMFKTKVEAENVPEQLIRGRNGFISTIGITLCAELIRQTGFFNENLKLHQDTEYWIRAAYRGQFLPGETKKAVSVRRVHPENRVANAVFLDKSKYYASLFNAFKKERTGLTISFLLIRKASFYSPERKYIKSMFLLKYAELVFLMARNTIKFYGG